MRRAPTALLALAAAALASCGDPLLFAELQIPRLAVTLPSQTFPASDTTDPATWCALVQDPAAPCIQLTLDYDLGGQVPVLDEPGVTYDLRLTDVAIALTTTGAGEDLAGVRQVTVLVLATPGDPGSGVVVASYARLPGAAPTTVAIAGNSSLDLGPYLAAGRLPVRVEVTLDSGTPEFLADVTVGFSLEVQLDYGELL